MGIKELVQKAYENASRKGFWEDWERIEQLENMSINISEDGEKQVKIDKCNAIATRLMLIVSEVSEALEGIRKDDRENFKEELADIVIRVADLAGGLDIDLEKEIKNKMDKNKNRPYKHGKAF
ncbi:MazG nucleotide pyrophosphohydrolase domain-containing protein [Clostridium botulinum]|uniref:MazG nucleotide pyrophosphohydrolase domain-containing protein n=1 Tax=Clostridium botulinum TaxID=1491 RepID=UPI001E54E19E|nr:MazG nucleotide pyrophosphohydrolase domain-containing protein [Clostridium botulinum]MCC5422477.1 nucleotide pyrophosphohydrolase [Clostridium botulinum]